MNPARTGYVYGLTAYLMWGLFRHEEALAVNDAGRERLPDGSGAVELDLNKAMLLTYTDRPVDYANEGQFADLDPVPAVRELEATGALTSTPSTRLV